MKIRICLLVFTILFLFTNISLAAFEFDPTDIGVGARPLGMGKAYVGLSDDGSAIFMNAAGLANANDYQLISMAGNLMEEIPYTVLGGSFKALDGDVGIGYVGVSTTGIQGSILVGNTPEATGDAANYNNSTFVIGYARETEDIPLLQAIPLSNMRIGAGLKVISEGFSGGGATFEASGSGFDLDIATMFDVDEDVTVGISAKNVIPGENIRWKNSGSELPMTITPGVNWSLRDLNANVGLDAELIESRGMFLHFGGEWWPVEYAAIRMGLDQKPSAGDRATNLSAGLGMRYKGFTVDYAYHTYEDIAAFTTHYFSIGYIGEPRENLLSNKAN